MTEQERIELLKKVAELKAGLEFIAGQRITSSYQVGFKIDSMRDKAEEILPLLDTLAKELKEAEAAVLKNCIYDGHSESYCIQCRTRQPMSGIVTHKPDCIVARIQAKGDTGGVE